MSKKTEIKWLEAVEKGLSDMEVLNRVLVIHLKEDLDHHNAVWIREEADKKIERENVKHVVFDFENVNFMDSSGIGVIMGRYKKVIFIGGKAAVVNVGSSIDRIMNFSGLYKIIEKYDSVQEALIKL